MTDIAVDLKVDLNSEDDSGLPWGLLDEAKDPASIKEGGWIVVASVEAAAVAQVAGIEGNVVHVRPLRGSVAQHRHLLGDVRT